MRLTGAVPPFDPDTFGRRLNGPPEAPVAVAVSGGGDSMALLLAARLWADRAGRGLLALTVDHGLAPASGAWTGFVADRSARLGAAHRALAWTGEKPSAGLPAAARAARHALLAEAAREAGAAVILMAHTADDLAEAAVMRAAGATVPDPLEWAPSPAWPEGRGVFLFRPLLRVRRADLRGWLAARDEAWIEDPSNDDLRFARARARCALAFGEAAAPAIPPDRAPPAGLSGVREGPGGDLTCPREALAAPGGQRLLAALCLSAAGASRPPRGRSLQALQARLAGRRPFTASLAGARIEADERHARFCRESGEYAREAVAETAGAGVFDGRFEIRAAEPGWRVRPLRGLMGRLSHSERRRLAEIPAAARGALPLASRRDGGASLCPVLSPEAPVRATSLAGARLFAALGAFRDEAALWRVAKAGPSP